MALIPLSKSDPSRLHPDTFDVRGWEVRTEVDDHKIGSVDDVLMDTGGTPHLLDVDLGTFRRHVLVPISQAWADGSRRVVWVEGLGQDDIKQMPAYDHNPDAVTPEFECKLVDDYGAAAAGTRRREHRPAGERLVRLGKDKEFKVAKGSADPRGWKVIGGDGAKLGKVTELIVDQENLRVHYLDVDVEEGKLELEKIDRHVLVPVERARLDHKHKTVILDGLFARDLASYPVFTGLPLARGVEEQIQARYRAQEPSAEGWADRSARRFFGGGRQRNPALATSRSADAPASRATPPVEAQREILPSEGETIVRPREGEEVRIRLSGGDVIIEKHPGETDHG